MFSASLSLRPEGDTVEFTALGRLIGNAVPVELGRAIAKSIKYHLLTTNNDIGFKK